MDAVAFVTVDEDRGLMERAAGWFASPELRDALQAPAGRPVDPRQRRLVEAALERGRALLLPRVEAWEAALDLRAAAVDSLGRSAPSEVWQTYGGASVIAWRRFAARSGGRSGCSCWPRSTAPSRSPPRQLRGVEVVADLTAMAMERATLLEAEGAPRARRAAAQRAAEAVSGSLEPDEVYGAWSTTPRA